MTTDNPRPMSLVGCLYSCAPIGAVLALATYAPAQDGAPGDKPRPQFDYPVRVDVDGKEGQVKVARVRGSNSKGSYVMEGTWRKDYQGEFLTVSFPAQTEDWAKGSFRFMPEADGMVELIFRGRWERDANGAYIQHWARVDDIVVDGAVAQVANPGFEQVEKGHPVAWTLSGGKIVVGQGHAGERCAEVWFLGHVSQRIAVLKGRPVEVQFWYRPIAAPTSDIGK